MTTLHLGVAPRQSSRRLPPFLYLCSPSQGRGFNSNLRQARKMPEVCSVQYLVNFYVYVCVCVSYAKISAFQKRLQSGHVRMGKPKIPYATLSVGWLPHNPPPFKMQAGHSLLHKLLWPTLETGDGSNNALSYCQRKI